MSLLTFGYPGCLETQVAKKLNLIDNLRFCETWEEMVKGVESGGKLILPSWNSVYGHNFQLYRFLLNFDCKIIKETQLCPKYYLAAKSKNFELVSATNDLITLTDAYWREHRSYLLKSSENSLKALKNASEHEQFATICTKNELEEFALCLQKEIPHPIVKQKFVIVAKDLAKPIHKNFVAYIRCKIGKFKLEQFLYFFAAENVQVKDVCSLPTANTELKELIFFVNDDFRRARVRKIFNQITDLEWGEITVLGGSCN